MDHGTGIGDLTRSFPFVLPTRIEFGVGTANRVVHEVGRLGTHAFVVTDPGVSAAGLVGPSAGRMRAAGLTVTVFDEVEPNPRVETVDRAAGVAAARGADVVIAIGGGSSIDAAKGVAAVMRHGGSILDYEGMDAIPGPTTPLVAVPTTSGTGSEVTLWAVITDPARDLKMAVGSTHLAPRVALLDPELTVTMPPHVTATTGLDALTHAIEGYTARCANPVSDALALYAIELISLHLEQAVADGEDRQARSAMLLGSLLAGMCFGNADTAAVHSMAEAVGGVFDIAHGWANAIFLPYVVRHNIPAVTQKVARIGAAMGIRSQATDVESRAAATVDALFALIRRLGIAPLRETGVTESDLPKLAALAQANLGTPDNPVDMDEAQFMALFRQALTG